MGSKGIGFGLGLWHGVGGLASMPPVGFPAGTLLAHDDYTEANVQEYFVNRPEVGLNWPEPLLVNLLSAQYKVSRFALYNGGDNTTPCQSKANGGSHVLYAESPQSPNANGPVTVLDMGMTNIQMDLSTKHISTANFYDGAWLLVDTTDFSPLDNVGIDIAHNGIFTGTLPGVNELRIVERVADVSTVTGFVAHNPPESVFINHRAGISTLGKVYASVNDSGGAASLGPIDVTPSLLSFTHFGARPVMNWDVNHYVIYDFIKWTVAGDTINAL